MFEELRMNMEAVENILNRISYEKDDCNSSMRYWYNRIKSQQEENPDADVTYERNAIKKCSVELEYIDKVERYLFNLVKDSIK